ncbi:hypothetical protein [Streptomyces ambofaciens]|uniref:hypothetical protein n=1 Tax=Streptomyces ambofaciens TaxID=1889 RepID=UPI000B2E1B80|nr:hypothetical protein [Streptomyces ambofaciens]
MTEDPAAGSPQARAPSLAGQVEGYLLLRAEREQARREAAALCARLPWLTSAQADDLACHYTEQRLGLTRHVLRSTARRADRLHEEYEARYLALRRTLLKRHAAAACAMVVCVSAAVAAVSLAAR